MNNKIFLFFNHPAKLPAGEVDKWNNWDSPDTTKLAWVCADSWRRNGWSVTRMSSAYVSDIEYDEFGLKPTKGFLSFTYQLKDSQKVYPLEFFNFWFAARDIIRDHYGNGQWFLTIDVMNHGFSPAMAEKLVKSAEQQKRPHMITLQNQHFSASLVYLTEAGCDKAIETIRAYDRGEFPALKSDLVSDETVIRHYMEKYYAHFRVCWYAAVEEGWESASLLHIPRSVLGRLF